MNRNACASAGKAREHGRSRHSIRGRSVGRMAAYAAGLVSLCLLSSCYLTTQGARYLSIVATAKSAEKLLADPGTDDATRRLLETALDARAYAIGTIGLRTTKNYRSLAKVDSDHLVTVVQACAELSFDRYLWTYPFVGKLPYKGFFDPKDAEAEAERLKKLGYDVIRRPSDAFSTLGFLADPLFSFMKSWDEYDIVELVIHEMTHATIFLRDRKAGNFNEELATFVGRQGALDFIASRRGKDSGEYASALAGIADAQHFSAFLRGTAQRLEEIYTSRLREEDKREAKKRIIGERSVLFGHEYASIFSPEGFSRYRDYPMDRINNALLDLYRLYEGEPELYRDYYEKSCGSDLATFVRKLKEAKNPVRELRTGP